VFVALQQPPLRDLHGRSAPPRLVELAEHPEHAEHFCLRELRRLLRRLTADAAGEQQRREDGGQGGEPARIDPQVVGPDTPAVATCLRDPCAARQLAALEQPRDPVREVVTPAPAALIYR